MSAVKLHNFQKNKAKGERDKHFVFANRRMGNGTESKQSFYESLAKLFLQQARWKLIVDWVNESCWELNEKKRLGALA